MLVSDKSRLREHPTIVWRQFLDSVSKYEQAKLRLLWLYVEEESKR